MEAGLDPVCSLDQLLQDGPSFACDSFTDFAFPGLVDSVPGDDEEPSLLPWGCEKAVGSSFLVSSSSRAEGFAQPCPTQDEESSAVSTPVVSPCPSDRWCESSGSWHNKDGFDPPPMSPLLADNKRRSVTFDLVVEVVEFDPEASVSESMSTKWLGYGPSDSMMVDAFQEFWDTWNDGWHRFVSSCDFNGPLTSFSNGRTGQLPRCSSSARCCDVTFRNEDHPAPAIRAHPVRDPRDFIPEIEDDTSDNDIGVSFFRWIDVLSVTDLVPYRRDAEIPFITYGLRGRHLGRRDFSSPDMAPSRLRHLIWDLWQDEVPQFEQVHIHFVRPQPVREIGAGIVVLLIEITCDEVPPRSSPVLALTCDPSHRLMDVPLAMYVPRVADSATLTSRFGMSYLCTPRGFRHCQLLVAASPIGPYLAPVPEGALLKLTISARLRVFTQAMRWFPDIERFTSAVREAVRGGSHSHTLALHMPGVARPALVQFQLADILSPPRFYNAIQDAVEQPVGTCYPVDHEAVNLPLQNDAPLFHAMAFQVDSNVDAALVVVTRGVPVSLQESSRIALIAVIVISSLIFKLCTSTFACWTLSILVASLSFGMMVALYPVCRPFLLALFCCTRFHHLRSLMTQLLSVLGQILMSRLMKTRSLMTGYLFCRVVLPRFVWSLCFSLLTRVLRSLLWLILKMLSEALSYWTSPIALPHLMSG